MNLLLNATTVTTGPVIPNSTFRIPSFVAEVTGTGSVSATIVIEARNNPLGGWMPLATINLSGVNSDTDGFGSLIRYTEYRARLTAISGTGASVTVTKEE